MEPQLKQLLNGKNLYKHHKKFWTREHIISLVWAIVLSIVALLIQKYADAYVSNLKGVYVGDLILDHIPTIDLDIFIVQGALVLSFITILILILKPRYILFTIKSIALFIIIRSFFISLTHLGVDPHQLQFDTSNIGYNLYNYLFNTSGDFFFSGHTGLPFLMFLIFWHEKFWRDLFLLISIIFGISVLFAHIHYSIDVFAAPFMVYGIFTISRKIFLKDYELLFKIHS